MNPIFAEANFKNNIYGGLIAVAILVLRFGVPWLFEKIFSKPKPKDNAGISLWSDDKYSGEVGERPVEICSQILPINDSGLDLTDPANADLLSRDSAAPEDDDSWPELEEVDRSTSGGGTIYYMDQGVKLLLPEGLELPPRDRDSDDSDTVGQLRVEVDIDGDSALNDHTKEEQ